MIDVNYIIHKYWDIEEKFDFLQNSENLVYISENYVARFSKKNPRKEIKLLKKINTELKTVRPKNGEKAIYKDNYYCVIFERIKGNLLINEEFSIKYADQVAQKIVFLNDNLDLKGETFDYLKNIPYIKNRENNVETKYRSLEKMFDIYESYGKDTLIHSDLHYKNILKVKNKIVVIDYDDVRWGTIEEEISIHLFYIKYLNLTIWKDKKIYEKYKGRLLKNIMKVKKVKTERLEFYEDFRHFETYIWLVNRYKSQEVMPLDKIPFFDAIKEKLDQLVKENKY